MLANVKPKDTSFARIANFLVIVTPVGLIFSREISATLLVLVVVSLLAAHSVGKRKSPLVRDILQLARHPAGMALVATAVVAAVSVMWSPAPVRGSMHAFHFAGAVFLGGLGVALALRTTPCLNNRILILIYAFSIIILIIEIISICFFRGYLGITNDYYRLNRVFLLF